MLSLAILAAVGGALVIAFVRALVGGGRWPETAVLAVIFGVCLNERLRERALPTRPPPPPWRATGERFVDPGSGRLVQVWLLEATGARRYVDVGLPVTGRG